MTTTYVSQTFTAANGTAPANLILGRNPTVGGGCTVQSNRVDFATGSTGSYSPNDRVSRRVSVDGITALSVADVDVSFTLNIGSGESFPELILRGTQAVWDGQTGYGVQLNSGVFRLFRALNYSYATLASTSFIYGTGVDVTVRFRTSGPTLQVWIGTTSGAPTFQVTDTAIPNAGFVIFNVAGGAAASSSHVFIDNLVVTDGVTTAPAPPDPPVAGTTPTPPTDGVRVEVDWDKSGTYQDHSADVQREAGLSAQYGRDQSTALAPTVSGTGSVTMQNRDGKFSPRNTDSLLYGKLKPGRDVRITRTLDGITYTLFAGQTDDQPITPDYDNRTVALSLLDPLAKLRGTNISTPVYSGLRTGEAIAKVLDAAGWPEAKRELDPGATYIRWWWEEGTDALTAIDRLLQSEGSPALLTIGTSGAIVFRDRHHRLTRDASLTAQSTWRSVNGVEPVMQRPGFSYDEAWRNIINTATVTVETRNPGDLQAIWTADSDITLSAGEIRTINISGSDPFIQAVAPVSGTDFTTVQGSIESTRLVRDSGASTALVIRAAVGGATISGLQVRAYPLPVVSAVQVQASDPESVDEYDPREFPSDLPWCNVYDAAAVTDLTVSQRSVPLPIITARFVVGNVKGRAHAILSRDLSDRVRIIEPNTYTDADFYVESIQHTLTDTHDHEVVVGLEGVPPVVTPVFAFDTAGQGFNDGLLGGGVDNPATIFRFDGDVGHRFNEGVWAT